MTPTNGVEFLFPTKGTTLHYNDYVQVQYISNFSDPWLVAYCIGADDHIGPKASQSVGGYNNTATVKLDWSGSDTPCWFDLKPNSTAPGGSGANSDEWSYDVSQRAATTRDYQHPLGYIDKFPEQFGRWPVDWRTGRDRVARDVLGAVQVSRNICADSNNTIINETSSRLLTESLSSLSDDLSSLLKIVGGKDLNKLSSKLAWVLKKDDVNQTLRRLEIRKTSMMLLLQSLTLQSHGTLHLEEVQLSKTVSSMQDRLDYRLDNLQQDSSELKSVLSGMSSDVPAKIDRLESLVGSLMDRMTAMSLIPNRVVSSQEELSLISRGHIATIMRQAIDDTLRPILEASLGKSAQHNEMILKQFQDVRDSAVATIGSQLMASSPEPNPPGSPISALERRRQPMSQAERHDKSRTGEEHAPWDRLDHVVSKDAITLSRPTLIQKWFLWIKWPGFGTLRFEVKTFSRSGRWFLTVAVDFWPSWSLLFRKRAISLCMRLLLAPLRYANLSSRLARIQLGVLHSCSCGRSQGFYSQLSLSAIYACVQKLIAAGCELEDCQVDTADILVLEYWDEAESLLQVNRLREFSDFLRRNDLELLNMASRPGAMWAFFDYSDPWPIMMALGLDPNARNVFGPDGGTDTPIMTALYAFKDTRTHREVCIDSLAMLIREGANIFDTFWAIGDWFDVVEDGVMTPTVFATSPYNDELAGLALLLLVADAQSVAL
ncbi:hypothetical protein VMCG_02101 [Cytospora schulzeri]|uniref:Uncharacterized protein n=1 Tax=Cytospora schulzeri TaxID=448051 RepID=A0A423X3N9_9PEZI|nr:hypothetical protein VMCG_02101 [Valsa malicola]